MSLREPDCWWDIIRSTVLTGAIWFTVVGLTWLAMSRSCAGE